jgi:ribosomal protein S7
METWTVDHQQYLHSAIQEEEERFYLSIMMRRRVWVETQKRMTRMPIMSCPVINQAVNNIMDGKDGGNMVAIIELNQKAFMERAFPTTNQNKDYANSIAIRACRPQEEVDYIEYVVKHWQVGVEVKNMLPGHDKGQRSTELNIINDRHFAAKVQQTSSRPMSNFSNIISNIPIIGGIVLHFLPPHLHLFGIIKIIKQYHSLEKFGIHQSF